MRSSSALLAALLGLLLLALPAPARAGDAKIQVLLITGDDVPGHPWKETSPVYSETLTASGKFDVKQVEGMGVLEQTDELAKYGLILFNLFNRKKVKLSDAAKANLVAFVKDGKGFMPCHLASASFQDWQEWNDMCGRHWVFNKSGHGPRKPFQAKIANKEDPITKGLEGFEADDELYAGLLGDGKIVVLVEADSDHTKKTEPLAFTLEYGKGRVFHNAFGHDAKALNNPVLKKLLVHGAEWAATGKVTD
jgi:type 1 glutamine amidotransferase